MIARARKGLLLSSLLGSTCDRALQYFLACDCGKGHTVTVASL